MSKTKNSKVRMYSRTGIHVPSKNNKEEYSIRAMFDIFLTDKSIEGLSKRTLHDYNVHFDYLMGFLAEEITNNQFSKELFKSYIAYMLHERGLSPVTENVRIRTIRAFLRYSLITSNEVSIS
jgi:integrase/recombinase XerD